MSFFFALLTGKMLPLGEAILTGMGRAVEITLSLCGMLCLWNGLVRVLEAAGAIRVLTRVLHPILRLFFPYASKDKRILDAIGANVGANLLGLGNAATPAGLRAMQCLEKQNPHPKRATPEEKILILLNCAPLTLLPANLLALRSAAGSQTPYAVLLPVLAVSVGSLLLLLLLSRILYLGEGRKRQSRGKRRSRDA